MTFAKSEAVMHPADGYVPVLRAGNIQEDGLNFDDLVYVPADRVKDRQKVRRNDVVVAASSGSLSVVGKAARSLQDFDGGFGAFCKVLRPGSAVDPSYFAHYFRTSTYRQKVSSLAEGANINNLKNEHLDDLIILMPPLDEQRRVAAILDQADALRVKRRQALSHFESLTQSVFFDMFGTCREWPSVPLGSLGEVTTGKTPPTRADGMFNGSIPFVTPGDLNSGVPVARTVTEAGAGASRVVRAGATMVCCIGATIGKTDKAAGRSAFNQQINAIAWGESVRDEYGLFALRNLKATIVARGASTTLPLLPKGQFTKLVIPVPPLDLQNDFENRITAISAARAKGEVAAAAADQLFRAIQSLAFGEGV